MLSPLTRADATRTSLRRATSSTPGASLLLVLSCVSLANVPPTLQDYHVRLSPPHVNATHGRARSEERKQSSSNFYLLLLSNSDFLLLGYVIYQFLDNSHDAVHGVGWRFALVGVLNAIFVRFLPPSLSTAPPLNAVVRPSRSHVPLYLQIHVFVTRHFIVAFIFALLLASSVSTIYYSLSAHYKPKGLGDALFVHLPFSLWHAWSIVTVLISGFALFTQ